MYFANMPSFCHALGVARIFCMYIGERPECIIYSKIILFYVLDVYIQLIKSNQQICTVSSCALSKYTLFHSVRLAKMVSTVNSVHLAYTYALFHST
jgi:hypothetical protein